MLIQKINSIIFHSGNFQLFEEKNLPYPVISLVHLSTNTLTLVLFNGLKKNRKLKLPIKWHMV